MLGSNQSEDWISQYTHIPSKKEHRIRSTLCNERPCIVACSPASVHNNLGL